MGIYNKINFYLPSIFVIKKMFLCECHGSLEMIIVNGCPKS